MTGVVTALEQTLRGDLSWAREPGWDVSSLARAAENHGVEALLWNALSPASAEVRDLREALSPRVRAEVARDLLVQRDLRIVLAALASAGLRALVIKGSALAYSRYPQSWLRPRTDTDILVTTADVPAAEDALRACGYRRSDAVSTGAFVSHQMVFERIDVNGVRQVLDLHWKVVNPQLLADVLPFDWLWHDCSLLPALGSAARVPSTVNSIVLSAVHRLAHHQSQDRLIWLYDLCLLTEGLTSSEWCEFQELACRQRVAGLCLDMLREARDRIGGALPEPIEQTLAVAAPSEPSRRYLEGTVRKRDVLTSDLAMLTSWRDRWRLLREHAFPPASYMRRRYGVKSRLLLPAFYLHRLVTGVYKWARS